jgi:2',3'-cyclic-nucleotide 2'-phosphodiesterase (5'-nucleotidase family)
VANIDDSQEPSIQGKYNKSIIIERGGRKIGILGYILQKAYVSIVISDPGLTVVSIQDV